MFKQIQEGSIITIFGGTGDLTKKKLFPAIYHLYAKGSLPKHFALVCIGRRELTIEAYWKSLVDALHMTTNLPIQEATINALKNHVFYYQMDFSKEEEFEDLGTYLLSLDERYQIPHNRVYYLAVAPSFFDEIIRGLNAYQLANQDHGYARLVIEKPFGHDLKTAKKTNQVIARVFREENTYRIDHYLGKEMLQNILMLRFYNVFFDAVLNHKYIDQIQISIAESVGIGSRANYYEKAGAIRDMVQSHILQLISLITMDRPKSLQAEDIHYQKAKVLKQLKRISTKNVHSDVVIGQYIEGNNEKSYVQEENVDSSSTTDTYVALKLYIQNKRFKNVPIYIRTGKRLAHKSSEIIVVFKKQMNQTKYAIPNELIFKIQPEEGVVIKFNNKIPGTIDHIMPVEMNFCQNCEVGMNSPEAYEHLLYNVLRGDTTLFARWDEVYYSWKFIDDLIRKIKKEQLPLSYYPCGTDGPEEAIRLLENDQREWKKVEEFK